MDKISKKRGYQNSLKKGELKLIPIYGQPYRPENKYRVAENGRDVINMKSHGCRSYHFVFKIINL